MSRSLETVGVLLITVPAIEFGGLSLLKFMSARTPGYMDNPMRQGLFRAGHAHAGVLVMLALVALLYLDEAALADDVKSMVRVLIVAPPILMPAGFFFSVASPTADRPSKLIRLVYAGAAAPSVAAVTLGVGLLRAG
jgi:hypothetical protein